MSEPSGACWVVDVPPMLLTRPPLRAASLAPFDRHEVGGPVKVPVSHRLKIARRNPINYAPAVARALGKLRYTLRNTRPYEAMGMKEGPFWEIFDAFSEDLLKALRPTPKGRRPTSPEISSIADDVAMTIRSPGAKELTLENQVRFGFYNRVMQTIFTKKELENQLSMGDFRYPMEWFPKARSITRVLHLHVGPTNSGKTYNALKRLEESKGLCVYAGPLRLLAQEIYARMNARGKPTWLVTGDDRQPPSAKNEANPESMGISCTVEMVPTHRHYDIAVIDEIQMLADEERGTSWTNALIGLPAKEVHLCGEERAVDLVRHIARSLGEELIIHRYERLSPLEVMDKPLRGLGDLQKGDCVVCFSIAQIQKMKVRIEQKTGRKAAVVYGGLPAEIRAHQAHLFNDPDNDYDFLVASDAIGMGLNLEIRRVIFEAVMKEVGKTRRMLTVSEIKQIGGRAGRYKSSFQEQKAFMAAKSDAATEMTSEKTVDGESAIEKDGDGKSLAPPSVGWISSFTPDALGKIRGAMKTDAWPLLKAGVFPTRDMIELFCSYFPPGIPYGFILARLNEISKLSGRYFLCRMNDAVGIADAIEEVRGLSIEDRILCCYAPVSARRAKEMDAIREMARCIAEQRGGGLLELRCLDLDLLDAPPLGDSAFLQELEQLHKLLVLYSWMSYRFPGVFGQRPLAVQAKRVTEDAINAVLAILSVPEKTPAQEEPAAKYYRGPAVMAVPELATPAGLL